MWTHIHAMNKLRSSSVNNESPLSVAEQISEKKKRNITKIAGKLRLEIRPHRHKRYLRQYDSLKFR